MHFSHLNFFGTENDNGSTKMTLSQLLLAVASSNLVR